MCIRDSFIGILIENYAGAFPAWLAPEQVRVMPITDKFNEYAKSVVDKMEALSLIHIFLFAKSKSRAKGRENMAKAAGKTLFEGLLARKILVRNYSQHPLLPGALRISTGTLEENARIIEAVKEILEG